MFHYLTLDHKFEDILVLLSEIIYIFRLLIYAPETRKKMDKKYIFKIENLLIVDSIKVYLAYNS